MLFASHLIRGVRGPCLPAVSAPGPTFLAAHICLLAPVRELTRLFILLNTEPVRRLPVAAGGPRCCPPPQQPSLPWSRAQRQATQQFLLAHWVWGTAPSSSSRGTPKHQCGVGHQPAAQGMAMRGLPARAWSHRSAFLLKQPFQGAVCGVTVNFIFVVVRKGDQTQIV